MARQQDKKVDGYQILQTQLDEVLARLQASDVPVDEAVKLYEEGLALADKLEMHLREAKNHITELKLQASKPAAL